MTGPFGVEVINKSVKSQLKLVKETKGFVPTKTSSNGLKRIGFDDVKRAKLNMAGAQARRKVNGS